MQKQISVWQFVLLLYICRIFSTMTYAPAMGVGSGGVSVLISWVLSLGIGILVLLPALWLHSMSGDKNVVMLSLSVWRRLGVGIALCYFVYTMMTAVSTFAHFEFFMTNAIFPQSSTLFFIITMWIAAVYASSMGLEAIARTGAVVFAAFLVSFGFIVFASLGQVDLVELKLPLDNIWKEVGASAYEAFSRNAEFVVVLLLLPHIKGNLKKGVLAFLCMLVVTSEIIAFLILTVLGDYSATQTLPYYTLSSAAEFSIFQRLDALHMTVWVAIALVKIALYLFLSVECLQMLFPEKHKKAVSVGCCLLLFVLVLPFCYSRTAFDGLYRAFSSGIPSILLVIVFPLLIGAAMKIKKGRAEHETTKHTSVGAASAADLRN